MLTFGKERYVGIEEYRDYQETCAVPPDHVLALSSIRYTGDGSDIFSEYALVIRVVDGRFNSIRSFMSHAAAEQALALEGGDRSTEGTVA
jgi:ketosteroid isomerase-like protein